MVLSGENSPTILYTTIILIAIDLLQSLTALIVTVEIKWPLQYKDSGCNICTVLMYIIDSISDVCKLIQPMAVIQNKPSIDQLAPAACRPWQFGFMEAFGV